MAQGIKFYDPEVVGQTPEAIEFRGVQNLVDAAKPSLMAGDSITIFNPTAEVGITGSFTHTTQLLYSRLQQS